MQGLRPVPGAPWSSTPAPHVIPVDSSRSCTADLDPSALAAAIAAPSSPPGGSIPKSAPPVVVPAAAPAQLPPGPAALSIEKFVRIRAEIWEGRAPLAVVLERHDLDEATWLENERYHREELRREMIAGKSDRARALTEATRAARASMATSAQDPRALAEYAAIRAELDRASNRSEALRRLGLAPAEWAQLDRHWRRRALTDGTVAKQLRDRLAFVNKKSEP